MIVFARRLPINDVFARSDDRVASSRATRADTFRLLQKPNTHLESEIGGSQRADRTDIHRVKRIIICETLSRMCSEHGVTPAIDESQHIVMRGPSCTAFGFFTLFSRNREPAAPYSTLNSWSSHSPA